MAGKLKYVYIRTVGEPFFLERGHRLTCIIRIRNQENRSLNKIKKRGANISIAIPLKLELPSLLSIKKMKSPSLPAIELDVLVTNINATPLRKLNSFAAYR